jgi:cobalt-zinc-cadmium efflux system membrane fusion protein
LQAEAQKSLSDLAVAEKALERAHRLQADGAIAEKEVAQLEGELRKARADQARARAQLESLGVSPTDPAVKVALRSQIAGTVVERNVLVGQEVRADQATPLLTVSNLDTVWIIADVYEQDLTAARAGDEVEITVPAYPGDTFTGKIDHIGEVLDPSSRTVKIRCLVPNAEARLKPDMFAKVRLASGRGPDRIRVPAKAVLSDGDKSVVLVVSEGMIFRLRRVDVGSEVEGTLPVFRGLIPGEKIVTDGAIFMKREIESH